MSLNRGTRLGPYEILGLLGAGGMGEVYRARDPRIGREVAIKILPAAVGADPDKSRRFEQEIHAIGALNHPNILTIHDTGVLAADAPFPGAPFIVTELLAGRTLREAIASGPLAPQRALGYAIQIARGLSAAHTAGVVHRDVKPENLFLTPDGRVKILDFGIAKIVAAGSGETRAAAPATGAGLLVGTVEYMSPEQARGEVVDHRSDLFSVGVVLHEVLAGERPFRGRTLADCVSAVLRDDPAPLPADVTAAAPAVQRIVQHCLEKDPGRRYQSASDLAFDLESISTVTTPVAVAVPRRPVPLSRRWGIWAVATIVAVTTWLTFDRSGEHPASAPRLSTAPRATPFLAGRARERFPAWSPTGNLIAYVSDESGEDDVWVSDPGGTSPINLTAGSPGADTMPAWSPDGQRVAFYSDRDGGGIYTANALRGDVRRVTALKPGVLYTFSLTWARDGSLLYTNFDDAGRKQVYRVPTSGGPSSCMTCDTASVQGHRSGELSPSGELLLYKTSEMGARGDVLVMHLPSRRVTRVVSQGDMPRWSGDGKWVLFISGRDGTPDLWRIAFDPAFGTPVGEPERLTSGLRVSAFAAAPDGRQILVVTQKSQGNLWGFPADAPLITDLSAGRALTSGQFADGRPRWLPRGAGALFESNRRGSLDVWTLASPGGTLTRLTSGAGTEHRPRVSPDGRWIAFDVIDRGGEYTHVMRPDGSGVRIPDERWRSRFSMTCCADWSPDGTRLAMHINSWSTAIVRMDSATGAALETTVLDLPGAADEYHRWSPDGERIAYESVTEGSWDIWTVRPDGTDAHRLTTSPGNERGAAWHPSLPFIYFGAVGGGRNAIWRARVGRNGRPEAAPEVWMELSSPHDVVADGMDFTKEGDRLVVVVREQANDIWLVELN